MSPTSAARQEPLIVGMIHLAPLVGYEGALDLRRTTALALSDLDALEQGGVDAVMVENNYNLPHRAEESPAALEAMRQVTAAVCARTSLPVGVCVLWNDFRAALRIGRSCGAAFVRVPVFVDEVITKYGRIAGDPASVLRFRRAIGADDIALFVDVHVKHADLVEPRPIAEAARLARDRGADAVILTGAWTGDPPTREHLDEVRAAVGAFPILVGSGATEDNVEGLLSVADGVIVATSLKSGASDAALVNLKGFEERISSEATARFVAAARRASRRRSAAAVLRPGTAGLKAA